MNQKKCLTRSLIIYIIQYFLPESIDKLYFVLYYVIDHKVGAVGVLCPQARKGDFSPWLMRHNSGQTKQMFVR